MFEKVNQKYRWKELTKYVLDNLKNDKTGHDYQHIMRVMNNAMLISEGLSVNYDILLASILLHDISYKDKPSKTHHIESADIASSLLLEYGFEEDIIGSIHHAIINHNRSFNPYDEVEKMSLEAKILCDADTLDALGAIGLIRMISFSTNQGVPYFESTEDPVDTSFYGNIKFLEQMKENLILDSSKKLAEERMKIIYDFLKQMECECDGAK